MIVGRGVGEKRLEAVIVGLQDGVELVIVAARAAVGQAEVNGRGGVGDVVKNLLTALLEHAGVALIGIVTVERRRDPGRRIVGPQFVARDLLLHEAIVGLVLVQR